MADQNVSYSSESAKRVKRDLRDIMKNPPWGIFIAPDDANFMQVHCIITGPVGTPYEKGFFYFVVTFPSDYPMSAPKVMFMTTAAGKVRFNPNLYKCGKVCLSILGTWSGPEWRPCLNLTSVLISIQSLLCERPYHNEPGYEEERVPGDVDRYNDILRHETLRVAVCGMVLNKTLLAIPQSLLQTVKLRFLTYFDFYEQVALQHYDKTGQQFVNPFILEISDRNVFSYDEILEELYVIKQQLERPTHE